MQVTASIWSQAFKSLFDKSQKKGTDVKAARRRTVRRLTLESLERREVFSGDPLFSAISIGNATGSSTAFDIAVDSSDNSSYVTGSFSGTVDFDPSSTRLDNSDILTARGSEDAYVAKYAPDNSFLWAKRMGGDSLLSGRTDCGWKITIDGSGNVLVAGSFVGSSDFGTITLVSTSGDLDGYVAKLDTNGTFQWAKQWGGAGDDYTGGVRVDAAGNVYALGIRYYANTYDVRKYTPSGASVWTQSIVTSGRFGAALAVDASGNIFVGGDFHGTVDFDPSSKTKYVSSSQTYTSYSGFVLKLTNAGKFSWVSPFVGKTVGSDYGTSHVDSIALDGNGNVVVGGSYIGPVDIDPGIGTTILPGARGGFITKLNSSGGLLWDSAFQSDNTTLVRDLALDVSSNIFATGDFYGTTDFDPSASVATRTTAGNGDVFVLKLDSAGNFGWVDTFGGTGLDAGMGIAVDTSGYIYLAGIYSGTVDFDPDPSATNYLTNPGTYKNAYRLRYKHV